MEGSLWVTEQAQAITSVNTQDQLEASLRKIVKQLGFDFFAFGLKTPLPLSAPKTEMVNNYPSEWQNKYLENSYLSIDPTVLHGLSSILPVIWNEDLFGRSRELWEEARSYGLQHGWAQACRSPDGNIGMLTLARSDEGLTEKELQSNLPLFSWLAQLSFVSFSKFMVRKANKPALTQREIEVLRWTGEGKTSWEISIILAVSERTVNFHVNNVIKKLKVANKTAAVVQAVMVGLI